MKKRCWLALLTAVAFALSLAPAAYAQEGGFTETFEGESLVNWETSDGVVLQEGILRVNPGNFAIRMGRYQVGTLSIRVRHPGSGAVFLRFHMVEGGSYAVIYFGDGLVLEKTLDSGPQELGGRGIPEPVRDWVEIRVIKSGGEIQVFLDGEPFLEGVDPEPLGAGEVGLMVEGEGAAAFDDLSVETVAGEPVLEQLPVPAQVEAPTATPTVQDGRLSIRDLIDELSSSPSPPTEMSTYVINLGLSVLFSYLLSRVYIHWGSSLSNRRRFAANFILITVTTTFIILVVRSSVALSLGLVGALSIVRFRAAIKEPEELAYLFFAIGIGIGLGDNQRMITTLALVAAILILGLKRLFRDRRADFNLHVSVVSPAPGIVDLEAIMGTLREYCLQVRLVRFDDSSRALESSFLVEFRDAGKLSQARTALRNLSDTLEITFMDNKGIG